MRGGMHEFEEYSLCLFDPVVIVYSQQSAVGHPSQESVISSQ